MSLVKYGGETKCQVYFFYFCYEKHYSMVSYLKLNIKKKRQLQVYNFIKYGINNTSGF